MKRKASQFHTVDSPDASSGALQPTKKKKPAAGEGDFGTFLDNATLKDISQKLEKLSGEIKHLKTLAQPTFEQSLNVEPMAEQVEIVDSKVENVKNKIDYLATCFQMQEVNDKLDVLESKVDGIMSDNHIAVLERLDDMEGRLMNGIECLVEQNDRSSNTRPDGCPRCGLDFPECKVDLLVEWILTVIDNLKRST